LEGLEKKAKASGACQLVVKDLREEFVSEYIYPCLRAGAVYERKYLLGTSMARPVIAKVQSIRQLHLVYVNHQECILLFVPQ
jgi:argininosuccinate synthase